MFASQVIGSTTPFGSNDLLVCTADNLVDSRYELLEEIGRGGMSIVYRAKDHQLDRVVAIKMLNAKYASNLTAIKRFRREAIASSSINHPNIVDIYGFGIYNGKPYIAMEYLQGISLADHIAENGALSQEDAAPIFAQICDALAHTHKRGIVHRDLKPSNILLVGPDMEVRIVDFGIAKFLPSSGYEAQQLTNPSQVFGTVGYMSPEQCMGEAADERSDIYALGCIMYETLTGNVAFEADSAMAVFHKHLEEMPAEHAALKNAFGAIVLSCLAKKTEDRPQSMEELRKALLAPKHTTRAIVGGRSKSNSIMLLVAGMVIGFAAAHSGSLMNSSVTVHAADMNNVSSHYIACAR